MSGPPHRGPVTRHSRRSFLAALTVLVVGAAVLSVGVATAIDAARQYDDRCRGPLDAQGHPLQVSRVEECDHYVAQQADGENLRSAGAVVFLVGLAWAFLARGPAREEPPPA